MEMLNWRWPGTNAGKFRSAKYSRTLVAVPDGTGKVQTMSGAAAGSTRQSENNCRGVPAGSVPSVLLITVEFVTMVPPPDVRNELAGLSEIQSGPPSVAAMLGPAVLTR